MKPPNTEDYWRPEPDEGGSRFRLRDYLRDWDDWEKEQRWRQVFWRDPEILIAEKLTHGKTPQDDVQKEDGQSQRPEGS